MQVRVSRVVLAAGLLCAAGRLAGQGRDSQTVAPRLTVQGRIVSAATGDALSRARIRVSTTARTDVDIVLTDDDGRFAVRLDVPAELTLSISKAGYAAKRLQIPRETVSSGNVGRHELEAGAAIAGRVIDAAGAAAVGTAVLVRSVDEPKSTPWISETDDRGEYRVGGLPRGRYIVAVTRHKKSSEMAVELKRGEHVNDANLVAPPVEPASSDGARQPASRSAQGGASVDGRVLSDFGEPLGGATVQLRRADIVMHQATAREDGSFAMGGVDVGSYKLHASMAGYVGLEYGQQRAAEGGRTIKLGDDDAVRGLTLVLPRGSVIAGSVTDEHGEPVEGAVVRALQLRYTGRMVAVRPPGVGERRTDDRGQFRLFGLLPGSYIVSAFVDAAVSSPARSGRQGYATSYYPGAADIGEAWRVQLDARRNEFGAHVVLAPSPATRISGRAFASDGKPFAGTVWLGQSHRSRSVALEPGNASVASDGSFLLTNVSPGDYVIQAVGSYTGETPAEFAMQHLTITDADPPPVILTTSTGAVLEGRVIIEGRTGPMDMDYLLTPIAADPDYAPLVGGIDAFSRDSFGWFKASGLTGPTRLALTGAPVGWFLKSVEIRGRNTTDVPFDFGFWPMARDARVVIGTTGGTISGKVTDGDSTPVSDYSVLVFPTDRTKWFPYSRFFKSARPAQDDSFEATGLPPAEYYVAAVETLDTAAGEAHDPAVLDSLARNATRVSVSESDRLELTLKLVRR